MARARNLKKINPLKRWWRSKKEHHFRAYTIITLSSFFLALYCFIFLFFMDGVTSLQQDGNENLTPFVWLGLIGGTTILFIAAPDFFFFLSQKQILESVLELESRPEVLRRRKEAESAADLLGPVFQARLKGLFEMLDIKAGKKYSMDSLPPRKAPRSMNNPDSIEEE